MADYNIKAEITADASGYESGIKKAEKASKKLSTSVSKVIQGLGKNGLVGALGAVGLASSGLSATLGSVVKIARKVSETMNECTNAYKTQAIAEKALDTAIKNNPFVTGDSAKALKQFASEMQKVSNYGDEELIPMMTNLVSLGRTETETMQIMSVAMDMSAGMGISLDSAITQLNATLNGNIGRLGQQNRELKDLTDEELKQGKAIEILGEKFKGLSSATADTSKQLQNIKGDFKEALGQFTLPSSDMWNKFWAGFYENGIKVLSDINKKINEITIGKSLAKDFESQLSNLTYTGDRIEYLRDAFSVITDEELEAIGDYLGNLRNINTSQKQLLERVELEKQRRIDISEIEKQMAESSAKRKKEAEEIAEQENGIAKLKETHLKKIAEQEAKWENIKKVTGEEVKLEEKLKFYQDDLVAIMTEAGGQITTNNQYYKDQMAIIDKIREELGLIVDDVEEITVETEIVTNNLFDDIVKGIKEVTEQISENAKDWSGVVQTFYDSFQNAFSQTFTMLGENLVGAGNGYEDFARVALKALSEVLQSIGAQLSALAVLRAVTYDYASAAVALAGAAAAFTASGVASGMAERLKRVKIETQELTLSLEDSVKAFENLKKAYEDVVNSFTKTTSSFKRTRTDIDAVLDGLREQLASVQKAQADVYKEAQEYYEKYLKPYEYEASGKKYIKLDINSRTYLKKYKEMLEEASKYGELYNDILAQMKEAMEQYNSVISDINENYKAQIAEVDDLIDSYNYFYGVISDATNSLLEYNVIYSEQLLNVKKLVSDVYTTITHSGQEIGTNIVSAILDGATKQDFLTSMKEYIRTNLIKVAIYTESFQDKLAKIGTKLSTALITGGNIKDIKGELSKLWDEASKQAEKAEKIISDAFGDLQEPIEETGNVIETVEKKLTKFEQLVESFKETVSDLGGDIATNLVDGISDGLSQSDFLDNMKKWIRKMLVQSVVYTNSMKAEIEAIGQAITKGLSEGFTETTFHEIRRDLSWIFNEANKTIENIDDILNSVFGGGYATGTNNATSGLHLVGEAGPELVRFRGGEQVINSNNTNKALAGMGGKTNNFNVTFNNLQDTTAFAMMNQFKQYNRQLAINGIM